MRDRWARDFCPTTRGAASPKPRLPYLREEHAGCGVRPLRWVRKVQTQRPATGQET